jgi:methyl-accepting chemotaxis protein
MKKTLEERLLEQYGGKNNSSLPQTLIFDHVSPATRLLEKRRQMFEVQEALNSQKEEFSRREDAFRRREDGLRRTDLKLQSDLIIWNKFLQENEQKRMRAKKRIEDERKQCELKDIEIKALELQLQNTLKEEKELKTQLEKNMKYQDYLESVVQKMSKFFQEISDITRRYEVLRGAYDYLRDKQNGDEATNEELLKEFNDLRKSRENQALNINNAISDMQEQVIHVRSECNDLLVDVDQATQRAGEKMLQLGQILSSVTNILDRCDESFRIRHNKPKMERSGDKLEDINAMTSREQCDKICSKLDEIAMFIIDLQDIKEEYLAEKAKANNQNAASYSYN